LSFLDLLDKVTQNWSPQRFVNVVSNNILNFEDKIAPTTVF